jgi:5-methyltetrahydropteroyltriglutamate--homocysteine methyltransferase
VGSLLRPEPLKQARERLLGRQTSDSHLAPHDNAELRAIEDRCIRETIAMQERVGLKAITDGELRRRSWWLELILNWDGFTADRTGTTEFTWHRNDGTQQAFSRLWLNGRIGWRPSAIVHSFEFLKANTTAVPKVTLPAPNMVHLMLGGDRAIRESVYGDRDEFWVDLVAAYRREIAALVAAGARYIQLDDTAIAFLCDPAYRQTMASWGSTPEALLDEYAQRINDVISDVPQDVAITLHQCRGNREGTWAATGGYDPVADVLFNKIDVDGYFLEYDTLRAGSFAPLRLLARGKTAVLGLVSSKTPQLESADELKRRIDEASRYAPLEQLALSPQCGFASSYKGNPLTESDQERKLARIVEVAHAIWPDA